MKNISKKCQKADLSFTYDGFTIYPKCNHDLFSPFLDDIFEKINFERHITEGSSLHPMYHKDNLSGWHSHFKLEKMLTKQNFLYILDSLVRHQLIAPSEKEEFIIDYDQVFSEARKTLNLILAKQDQITDLKAIFKFIDKCDDNKILADAHEYLLTTGFDYLRQADPEEMNIFRGENQQGEIVTTSKTWAMIEKMLALKLQKNLGATATYFTEDNCWTYAKQFANTHMFFTIKRKETSSEKTSKNFEDFKEFRTNEIRNHYNKHCKKFM